MMKNYLLTWYGLTDFRASLGLESSHGPVLGALLAEEYTDVVILGFTKLTENEPSNVQAQGSLLDPIYAKQFYETYANTERGNDQYTTWLQAQLETTQVPIAIHFYSVVLQHLNDTEGIYEVAIEALQTIAKQDGEKQVTLFLSPGTPVMAFVWAFAALRFPMLTIRLVSSSRPNITPEQINLPQEWIEWHGLQVKTLPEDSEHFDVIFHLFGEQRIPNLLGVLQFSCSRHIFVVTKKYPSIGMKQFVKDAEYGELYVDPYKPEHVRDTILEMIGKMSSTIRIGFNVTGGTKLMYAGALAACRKVNASPFYFDSRNNKVIFLNDFETIDTKLINSVETFIKLNGDDLIISKPGFWNDNPERSSPERTSLTLELWKVRSKVSKKYREISQYNENCTPFETYYDDFYAILNQDSSVEIHIGLKHFAFSHWPDFARYLSGGWFEEYTYMQFQPFVELGLIKDIRIGLELSLQKKNVFGKSYGNRDVDTYQQLDIVCTDGRRLYVIECKAGFIASDHIMKLQNIMRYFGGMEGQGILVSCFSPTNIILRKKIEDSKNLHTAFGDTLFKQLEAILLSKESYS